MSDNSKAGPTLSKKEYARKLPVLRAELLQAQFALRKSGVSVVVIISGVDGAGKGEVVHRLSEWLDPRGTDTQAFWQLSDEERERPRFWRFWRVLPSRGRIALFVGSWYTEPLVGRVSGKISQEQFELALRRIAHFEKMLAEDRILILKFALHLSKKDQRKRLKDLEQNPRTHWRVLSQDWKHHELYERFTSAARHSIRQTGTPLAPWITVEAKDSRYRDFQVGSVLLQSLKEQLAKNQLPASRSPSVVRLPKLAGDGKADVLNRVDLRKTVSSGKYRKQLTKFQTELSRLVWTANETKVSTVMVFEGWDAAGKGSCIRRITEAMDPRLYRLIPVAAPTDEEQAHHYLWRFWRYLPRAGRVTIFDRSWYGRVLVERVEGFATDAEWKRAYSEIREFEEQIVGHGCVLVKFWIHIGKDEQLRRFKKREEIAYKRHKITDEDWRNRKKWSAYESAVNEMVARTSTSDAPWTIVAGNDKKFARIQILKTVCDRLGMAL